MTSAGHCTVPGRRPAGVCTHRTIFVRNLYRTIQTVPVWALYDVLTNRPMPVRTPDDARPGTGRTATGKQQRVFADDHISFT